MLRRFLMLSSALLLLTACSTSTVRGDLPRISEEKLRDCPQPTALKSGSHNEVERWATEQGFKYRDCADGKHELAEAVRLRQRIEGVEE